MHPGRPVLGVLRLAWRNACAAWRVDSPLQRTLRVAVLSVAVVVNCVLSWLLARALGRLEGAFQMESAIAVIALGLAATWIVPSVVFGARFTADLPLLTVVHLPIGFRRLYLARLLTASIGSWLAVFLPPLAALVWSASSGAGGFLRGVAALLMLVLCLSEASTLLFLLLERWTARWRALAVLLVVIAGGAWTYTAFGPSEGLQPSGALGALLDAWPTSPAGRLARVLPSGFFAATLAAPTVSAALWPLTGLAAWLGALVAVTFRTLLARVLGGPPVAARRAGPPRAVEVLLGWTDLPPFRRAAPGAALMVQALLGYVRIPNVRLLLLAGIPYCIAFPALLRGAEMMPPFVFGMLWVPVMFFISVKSNLLGADPSSVRAVWWYPVDAAAPIRARLAAVNVLTSLPALLMYATIAVMSPHVVSMANVWSAFAFWVSQLAMTDAFGAVASVTTPRPVTWGRAAPSGNDAQILLASGLTGGLALAFTIASALGLWLQIWWILPAGATATMIILLQVRRAVLNGPLPRLVEQRRDRILAALPLGS